MQILLEPITLTEEKDLFYSTRNEPKELGCIGHLRGDFGSDGKEFFSTWFPHEWEGLNDQRFKSIFDTLINQLRKAGEVLSGRTEMERYCSPHHDCKLLNPYVDKCWGFRIYSPNHYAFYLRCMPVRGDYNFYIYCYDKNMLLDKLARDRGLPRYCYTHNTSVGSSPLAFIFRRRSFNTFTITRNSKFVSFRRYTFGLLFFMDYPFLSVIVYHKRKKKATVLIKANKHTNLANDVLVFLSINQCQYTPLR